MYNKEVHDLKAELARQDFIAQVVNPLSCRLSSSAVHRSRRAGGGAGVLTYFAGAGARVCSPPAKLLKHLFVLQTTIMHQQKNL